MWEPSEWLRWTGFIPRKSFDFEKPRSSRLLPWSLMHVISRNAGQANVENWLIFEKGGRELQQTALTESEIVNNLIKKWIERTCNDATGNRSFKTNGI